MIFSLGHAPIVQNKIHIHELALDDSYEFITNSVYLGLLCASSLHQNFPSGAMKLFLEVFAWTNTKGGHCVVDVATQEDQTVHGAYIIG